MGGPMKTALMILLLSGFAQAQLSDEEAAKMRQKMEPFVNQIMSPGNTCGDVATKFGTAAVRGPRGSLAVNLLKSRKSVTKNYLPSFGGPSQRCLDVKHFPEHDILLYRVYKGESSPAGIESVTLAIYKVSEGKVMSGGDFVILDRDVENNAESVVTYRTLEREGNIILELNDRTLEVPVTVEHVLNKLQWQDY